MLSFSYFRLANELALFRFLLADAQDVTQVEARLFPAITEDATTNCI